jgi:uncharacterized protein with LGFP repeats
MSTLDDLNAGPGGLAGMVNALSRRFHPVSRRDVLVGATVAATALATKPREYALTPVAAYATICGPGNTASSGWTVFCATVNKGVNTCPPGSFAAGWWKAAGSSWCGGGYRYIVDCNARCSKCTTGCSDHLCDSRCWSCSCGTGSKATCDQRRVCCNAFRYGQCNTGVKCSGGVHCRVVSCVAPYKWESCTTTSLSDNRTSEHSTPYLPVWSAITAKYHAMGEQGSWLKASTGPQHAVGDGRGQYVSFQGGRIWWSSKTGGRALTSFVDSVFMANGGPRGALGYPTTDRYSSVKGGWVQFFEGGAIADSPNTTTQAVWGIRYDRWRSEGGEGGHLGYPSGPRTDLDGGAWIQTFEGGAITDSTATTTQAVSGAIYTAWVADGREKGVLRFPTAGLVSDARGSHQVFQGGELWALGSGAARVVYGAVLAQWKAAGGAGGRYGYPLTDTTSSGGQLTCRFEGGTITT